MCDGAVRIAAVIVVALAFAAVAFARRRSAYARVALGIALVCVAAASIVRANDVLSRVSIVASFGAAVVLLVVAYRAPA